MRSSTSTSTAANIRSLISRLREAQDEIQQLRMALEPVARLRAQAELPVVLAEAERETDVFDRVLDFLMEHGIAETAAIYVEDGGELKLKRHRGARVRGLAPARLPVNHTSVVAASFCDAGPRYSADCRHDLSRYGKTVHPQAGCLLGVPMTWRGHVEGVIAIYRREPGSLTQPLREDTLALGRLVAMSLNTMRLQRSLEEQARTDALTGLLNSHGFRALLPDLAATGYGVFFADADDFKQINDNHGHFVGDAVLVGVAQRLSGAAGAKAISYRYGGEEVVLLVPCAPTGVRRIAERLVRAVSQAPIEGLDVTISLGATHCKAKEKIDDAIRRADHAMRAAKVAGKNRAHFAPG